MKQYMEVGERGYYDKKRYRCVQAKDSNVCCNGCDLSFFRGTPKGMCHRVLCEPYERTDGKSVIFVLQPKYRKEVRNE